MCIEKYENDELTEAAQCADFLNAKWHNRGKKLAVFVNHEMLDEISEASARLASYSAEDIDAHFVVECAEINTVLHRICDEQRFIIEAFY